MPGGRYAAVLVPAMLLAACASGGKVGAGATHEVVEHGHASDALLLAARAHHVRRWEVPRSSQPAGRNGYLRWREDLKKFHAESLGAIMKEAGYPEASVAKARSLLVRKNLSADAEGQTLEDAACLVFLQFEFAEFSAKTEPAKMVEILRKSWGKMSPAARERALKLSYEPELLALVKLALEKSGGPG